MTGKDKSPPAGTTTPEAGAAQKRSLATAITVPTMPAVRVAETSCDVTDAEAGRAAMMPPEPPADAPAVRIAVPAATLPHRSEPPLSSGRASLTFRSILPEGSRDTDEPRSTEVDAFFTAPVARDRILLLRLDGAEAGDVRSLGDDEVLLGRHPSNAISVNDPGVSRVHAAVIWREGHHHVEDRGSRNGTFVNGAKTTAAVLADGDTLQLGPRVAFRYTCVDVHQEDVLRQLYESSKRDALTGAYNRQHFEERLTAEVAYAIRHATEVGLVLFDLDHFKQVNDTHGHPAGDTVLRRVAAIVMQRLRTEDIFARVGGEEFVVLLRGSDLKSAARVGERLRAAVATAQVHHEGTLIPVSISVGCASLQPTDENGGQELVEVADRRLYLAKNSGRNRVAAAG
ncbi:MAG: GGDEF domain-containing protein [Polyangiaceae bacterium]|nr:GGDEF domain-containing protein [Polyangiaceae bacterium]